MAQNNPRQPQPIRVALEHEEPEKTGDDWSILATAIVSQGNRTLDGRDVQFFLNGIAYDQSAQTDGNGRVQTDIIGIPNDARRISIEAQVVGQAVRARKIVTLPAPEKPAGKLIPARLIVDPRRVDNEINLFILVVDENNRGVPNARLIIVDGRITTHPPVDENGSHSYPIDLQPGEEREIGIYVAGFGDSGFRRTFKWRD